MPTNYSLSLQATQIITAGGRVVSQIRSADFQRDSAYFNFRNTIDQIIATVRIQFYQVLLNHDLIGVQEQSVSLLESQLQDQQNRFDAGTVPRFNVLQAQVALSNQIPALISARNNYRISQLTLARTLGLDFDPRRGTDPPLEAVGELRYEPRQIPLTRAIEVAKERRPFLKAQKATVLSNRAQVGVARSGFFPQISATVAEEVRSSPVSENIHDVRNGYLFGATGSWAIWDWGQTYGRLKQAKAVLEESKITLDDASRQVEVEVQQAYSNLIQGAELIKSTEQTVVQAEEALRLASARLGAGAGTQLEVLDARVQLTTAQSTRLQALFTYNAAAAEFDRATATETTYANQLDMPGTRDKVKSDAAPTPAPKPTPLPLNHAGNRQPVNRPVRQTGLGSNCSRASRCTAPDCRSKNFRRSARRKRASIVSSGAFRESRSRRTKRKPCDVSTGSIARSERNMVWPGNLSLPRNKFMATKSPWSIVRSRRMSAFPVAMV